MSHSDSHRRLRLLLVLCVVILPNVDQGMIRGADEASFLEEKAKESFSSLTPLMKKAHEEAETPLVELGRKLFFDPRFSADGVWSCMHCHQAGLYATDAQRLSRGVFDQFLPRNAPTVLNASLQFSIHWDGRFDSVEAQAAHALMGPGFGNKSEEEAMSRIRSIPGYAKIFADAFPDEMDSITAANFGKAVGAYERTLLTPGRFDDYLDGKANALTASEQKGLKLFLDLGCANCHSGINLGGESYEKFGEVSDYWLQTQSKKIDKGRFEVTKKEDDLYVFKVAPLRNVTKTPPYFHDGSVAEIAEAVKIMAKVQLDQELTEDQTSSLVDFLESLTGRLPANFEQAPILPVGKFSNGSVD